MDVSYFSDKHIMIYGMGISGKGAASLLLSEGISMVLYDKNLELNAESLRNELGVAPDTKVVTGELRPEDLDGIDLMILSPGVSPLAPDIMMAKERGIEVIGELETAYELSQGKVIAITGTNGKTIPLQGISRRRKKVPARPNS